MNAHAPREFHIRVPGSIANLGAGFDTLAVAVQLYLDVSVRVVGGHGELHCEFENCVIDGENYIERAFRFLTGQRGGPFPSLHLRVESAIPTRSGLGSSAAATVAGLRLYEHLFGVLPPQHLLNAACALEGHPDNVAASLLGGLTVSCEMPDRSAFAVRLRWPEQLKLIVLTPEFSLATSASRRVLPEHVRRQDAVFNLQRVALFLEAIQSGHLPLLREAVQDRLHQPFRKELVPGLEDALALEHPDLLGVCLGGAGPSIVALAENNYGEIERLLAETFRAQNLPFCIRRLGAHQELTEVM